MTGPSSVVETTDESDRRVGKSAALIGGITLLARIAGFGRILVLTWAVGFGSLLDVYNTASRVPNIIYEIVAGGALASLVIPLLAVPLARKEPQVVNQTASGLLTWTLTLLIPMAVVVTIFAEPIMRELASDTAVGAEIEMGARMIRVFAPQLPLYGIGIVLTGVLQAHRRFAWPALAPLLSSITVSIGYVLFAARTAGSATTAVDLADELILTVGTTLATAVMTFCLLIPMRDVGVRFRPTYRFGGAEVSRNVRAMAFAGAVTTGAWQLSLLLVLNLTNGGPVGTVGVYTMAQTLFMLPWGVLAVPLATSAYPALAEAYGVGDEPRYASTLAATTRGLLLLAMLGAAALVGLRGPLANLFSALGDGGDADPALVVSGLSDSIAALGPGLVGFALFALLTRALYARSRPAVAAGATVIGWVVVYAASIVLSGVMPDTDRALAVAIGNSVGMTVLGAALAVAVIRHAGRGALAGTLRAGIVGLTSGALAAAAGWAVVGLWGASPSTIDSIVSVVVGGVVILVVFGLVSFMADKRDVRPMTVAVLTRVTRSRANKKKVAE